MDVNIDMDIDKDIDINRHPQAPTALYKNILGVET